MSPIDADDFARRALRGVARNRSVIVVPASVKGVWYLDRLSPGPRRRDQSVDGPEGATRMARAATESAGGTADLPLLTRRSSSPTSPPPMTTWVRTSPASVEHGVAALDERREDGDHHVLAGHVARPDPGVGGGVRIRLRGEEELLAPEPLIHPGDQGSDVTSDVEHHRSAPGRTLRPRRRACT